MQCPFCKEEIKDGAIKCKHCRSMLADIENAKIHCDTKNFQAPNIERTTADASQTDYGLKKMNVFLLVFLAIITLGIYMPIWFLLQKDGINRFNTKEKLDTRIFVEVIILYSIIGILDIVSIFTDFQPKTIYWDAIAGITILIQSFKVRRILNEHLNILLKKDVSFSGVCTFFLTIFYLQYKINKL
jgi:hypothetical protein